MPRLTGARFCKALDLALAATVFLFPAKILARRVFAPAGRTLSLREFFRDRGASRQCVAVFIEREDLAVPTEAIGLARGVAQN